MTRYSHRNGETEPPTVAGRYWFDGYRTKHNGNRAHVRDMVEVNERGSVYNDVDGLTDEPHAYKGKWYGPIVAPWEQPAIPPDVRETIRDSLGVDRDKTFEVAMWWAEGSTQRNKHMAEVAAIDAELADGASSIAALTDDYEFAMRQVGDLSGAEL